MSDSEEVNVAERGSTPSDPGNVLFTAPPELVKRRRSKRQQEQAERTDLEHPTRGDSVAMQHYIRRMEEQSAAQHARIEALLNLVTQQSQGTQVRVDVKLTSFDADDSPYCMREWLEIATKNKTQHNISDDDMILKVGAALRKCALHYFKHWKPLERTWNCLVKDLVSAFPLSTTPYLTFVAIATERSKEYDTLSTYCHRKIRLLHSLPGINYGWDVILSIIEGCLDNGDALTRLKQMRPQDETELITIFGQLDNEARTKIKARRSHEQGPRDHRSRSPIRRPAFTGKCYNCDRMGHKSNRCPNKLVARDQHERRPSSQDPTYAREMSSREMSPREMSSQEMSSRPALNFMKKECRHCKKIGHVEEQCFFKNGFPTRTADKATNDKTVKKVMLIRTNRRLNNTPMSPIATALSENKQEFRCLLDTGADVSVIHEQTANLLDSPLQHIIRQIQGVGTGVTKAKGTCIVVIKLPQVILEVEFLVVPNGTIPDVDALIGWDVIGQHGLQLTKTADSLDLCYADTPANVCVNMEATRSGMDEAVQINVKRIIAEAEQRTPPQVLTGGSLLKDVEIIKDKEQSMRREIIKRLRKKQEAMKERFDKNRAVAKRKYKEGDLVMIQKTQLGGGKLAPRYEGPFKIITVLENDRFALQRVNGQRRTAVAGYEQLRHWPEIKEN